MSAAQQLWSPAALRDPYPIYEQIRRESRDGVLFLPREGTYVLSGHAAVDAALRSAGTRSSEIGDFGAGSDGVRLLRHMMLFRNGAAHARLRGLAGQEEARFMRWSQSVAELLGGEG